MMEAAAYIRSRTALRPTLGIVLGSGLGSFAGRLQEAIRLAYREIPGMPVSTAVGHAGELVLGNLQGVTVAAMSGRFHLYEGYTAGQVSSGIRLFHELGITRVILTNASGGIHPEFEAGSLVVISDHINLQGANPLLGPNEERLGPRFPDMSEAYCPVLRQAAKDCAARLRITLYEGVYAGVLGPNFETPAEIRYLRTIGADLVGMSTVAEAISANHMGMKVLGISCVTNAAAGLTPNKLDHNEVLETGEAVSATFSRLLEDLIRQLP